jgi:hypothetical protein
LLNSKFYIVSTVIYTISHVKVIATCYKHSQGTGTLRELALSGNWHSQGSGTLRELALSGKWHSQGSGTLRELVLSGKWHSQGSGTLRELALSGKWHGVQMFNIKLRNDYYNSGSK